MSRVGARREREGTVPRATAVPRLAKPARHAGYAPGAHRSIGGCRRSGEAASLRRCWTGLAQRRRRGGRASSVAPAFAGRDMRRARVTERSALASGPDPRCISGRPPDLLLQEAALDAHHLRPPSDVTVLAAEARVGKGAHQLARESLADHACADAENVQIVVLHRLVRGVMIVTDAGPDAGELVGGDTDADTAAAHRDPTLRPPGTHRLAHALGHLRVVRRLARVVGPEVGD